MMPAMTWRAPDITVRVYDWPNYGKTTSHSLDRRIMPDEPAVRDYCERRFGKGALEPGVDHTYVYRRQQAPAPLLWNLFTRLLNKSY